MKCCFPLVFLLLTFSLFANVVPTQTETMPFTYTQISSTSMEVTYQLGNYSLEDASKNGVNYQRIVQDEAAYTLQEGYPEVPMFSVSVALPSQGNIALEVVNENSSRIADCRVIPAQGVHLDGETRGFTNDEAFRSQTAIYPAQAAILSQPGILRGVRMAVLTVFPFSSDPVTGELTVRNQVTLRIHTTDGPGVNEVTRVHKASHAFDPFFNSTFLNYDATRDVAPDYQTPCILMITPDNTQLLNLVNQLAEWKRDKGFEVHVATLTETGSNNTDIKNYIRTAYETWDNPPEFVILVGDATGTFALPTFFETVSGYNGEGDHPYACLEGDDLLPEVFIGRLSVETIADMQTILSKINLYERQPVTDFPHMYEHSTLCGDTSASGLSCKLTMKYIKDRLLYRNPDHTFTEIYPDLGNLSPANMDAGINEGSLFFCYRGYYGCSGWTDSNISGLTNYRHLVNSVTITCDTGSFANGTSRSEAMLRAGTSASPKGGACGIAMATTGTHTQFNNVVMSGIFYGLFSENMSTMGQSIMRGKLALYEAYINVNGTAVQEFTHWCNLMGDPSMAVWHGDPITMSVTHDTTIPRGQGYLDVHAENSDAEPVSDAWVTLRADDGSFQSSAYTDSDGNACITFDSDYSGTVGVVVTKPDYITYLGSVTDSDAGSLAIDAVTVDDDNSGESSGNGNGIANPGETLELPVTLRNDTGADIAGATVVLTLDDDTYATVQDGEETYGAVAANATVTSADDFGITIAGNAPDRYRLQCDLAITVNGTGTVYHDRFWLQIAGMDCDVTSTLVNDGGNHVLDPGEEASFQITIANNGQFDATNVHGTLSTLDNLVIVTDDTATFGDVPIGESATCSTDSFTLHGLTLLVPGMTIPMQLVLTGDNGYNETETFELTIGIPSVNDPLPPDGGGYVCYDQGDTGYIDCPTYDWIEIDPNQGGQGTDTDIHDASDSHDSHAVFDLPFDFKFYGKSYNIVNICSNGFLSFGTSEQVTFLNWPIPGPSGPAAMVAAFWDDLYTGSGGIYTWYDEANHYYVVEWSNMVNARGSAEETFEIILYDQNFYQTSTFDGPIKVQYKVFNNSDSSGSQGNYCTVGLEDDTELIGLQYTYNNEYPTAARELENESALYFTGRPVSFANSYLVLGQVVIHDANNDGTIQAGESVNLGIRLDNVGLSAGTDIVATLSADDANVTITSGQQEYSHIDGSSTGINPNPFSFTVSPDCPNNHIIVFQIDVTDNDSSWSYTFSLTVVKPALTLSSTMLSDTAGNNDGIMDPGETVQLILNLANASGSDANDVTATISCDSNLLTFATQELSFGDIPTGTNLQKAIDITVSPDAPVGTAITYTLVINAYGGIEKTFAFQSSIGVWGFSTDLEANNAGFNGTGGWQWGAPVIGAHSGTNAWCTYLSMNYTNNADWKLDSPAFFIGGMGQISFYHNYQTQSGIDGGNLKISVDNGSTWTVLMPTEGTYNTDHCSTANAGIPGEPCFSGYSNGWRYSSFDLSAYAGQYAIFRWQFGSDATVVAFGWTIDDVTITGCQLKTGIANGSLTLAGGTGNLDEVRVSSGNFTTHPDTNGNYSLYLPAGTFTLTGSLSHYAAGAVDGVNITEGQTTTPNAFEMHYLTPATNLNYTQESNTLALSWDFDPGARTRNAVHQAGVRQTFRHYNLYRQEESGNIVLINDQLTEAHVTDTIDSLRTYHYYVTVQYAEGESDSTNIVSAYWDGSVGSNDNPHPDKPVNALLGNFPNPFNPETAIRYSLASAGNVELTVYNLRGQRVRTLVQEAQSAGSHQVIWNGRNDNGAAVASGVYFYRLKTPGFTKIHKALLLK